MSDLAKRLDEIKGYLDGTDKGQWEALKVIDEAVAALSTEPTVISFGTGNMVVGTGTFDIAPGQHFVIIQPAIEAGAVGEKADEREDRTRIQGDEVLLSFPTAEQASRVADAICNVPQPTTLPVTVREERMHPGMVKYHIEGMPRAVVIHHFTTTDGGPPHDHPWSFQSTVLAGGYVERVHQLDGSTEIVHRQPDDTFEIAAKHIHRIEELPTGECWTLILPRQHEQTSGFYEFREDGAWQRRWNEPEWSKVE